MVFLATSCNHKSFFIVFDIMQSIQIMSWWAIYFTMLSSTLSSSLVWDVIFKHHWRLLYKNNNSKWIYYSNSLLLARETGSNLAKWTNLRARLNNVLANVVVSLITILLLGFDIIQASSFVPKTYVRVGSYQ